MGFLAAGTYICFSFRPTIPVGNGRCHSGSRWSKAPSSHLPLTLSSVLCAATLGPEATVGASVGLQRIGACVETEQYPCAGSPSPSLPLLTFGSGQVHPFVYWDNPMGHSRFPTSSIWPLLFAQSLYSMVFLPCLDPVCPSAHPCCGHRCCFIFAEVGRARHGDGRDSLRPEGPCCWSWGSGLCFWLSFGRTQPLGHGLGTVLPHQSLPRLPCLCGTKSCGCSPA